MIGTILLPLDGSPVAEAALPSARWIASRTGAPSPDMMSLDQERGYLADTAKRLGLVGGRPDVARSADSGSGASQIMWVAMPPSRSS